MARTIDYLTFMVDVTPYEHEGNKYNALNIIVAYRKGQGFVITWQPVKREPMGYMTGPMPSRDILVSGSGFVVKEASRNNVRTLEQMRTNLEVAKEGVKFYFDQRDFDTLKTFMGDVANYGYTANLENKINELINNSKSSTVMTTYNKTNESANVQNAQVNNNESPMMKQYRELKEKHPGALLLFRCGDFYETYFEDAATVNEVLGVTVTKNGDTTMAGFPHHALDKYLPMLIRAGKRVAICDQLESEERRVKSEESATAAEPAKEDKAVTVPLGEHGTLVIGKPGFEPKEDKPKVTLKRKTPQPAEEPVKVDEYTVKDDEGNDVKFETVVPAAISEQPVDEIVEVNSQPSTPNSQLTYSTYKTKKGDTAPQIIGFGGPDDPRWQSHKDKAHKWCSASYRRDINGEKVYVLIFGTRYMDVAKALAGAYNTDDREAWKRAEDACMAIYEQAQRDGKARWEAKKAEWKQKAQERKDKKEADRKCFTKEDVAAMLNDLLAGKDIPEDVKKLMKAA